MTQIELVGGRITTLACLALFLAPSLANAAPVAVENVWEGDAMLRCLIAPSFTSDIKCDFREPNRTVEGLPASIVIHQESSHPPPLPHGNYTRVTLTIEWEPVSRDAEELTLDIQGNNDCIFDGPPNCDRSSVAGKSPLSVSLDGAAVQDTDVLGFVFSYDPCTLGTPPECSDIPLRVVMNQPYHWRWTFE